MSVSENNGVNTGELLLDPLADSNGRSPPMSDPQPEGTGPQDLFGRQPLLNRMIIHISCDRIKRILLQVVQYLDSFEVSQVNHHIGIVAEFGAQCLEFVRCL